MSTQIWRHICLHQGARVKKIFGNFFWTNACRETFWHISDYFGFIKRLAQFDLGFQILMVPRFCMKHKKGMLYILFQLLLVFHVFGSFLNKILATFWPVLNGLSSEIVYNIFFANANARTHFYALYSNSFGFLIYSGDFWSNFDVFLVCIEKMDLRKLLVSFLSIND